jgi:hypothetical protein
MDLLKKSDKFQHMRKFEYCDVSMSTGFLVGVLLSLCGMGLGYLVLSVF